MTYNSDDVRSGVRGRYCKENSLSTHFTFDPWISGSTRQSVRAVNHIVRIDRLHIQGSCYKNTLISKKYKKIIN